MIEKFSYQERELLRDEWRREHLDPDLFWRRVGLGRGQTLVDVGAGIGYFALPAARRVAPFGQVCAVDVNPDMVRHMEREAAKAGLHQFHAFESREDALPLPDQIADLVLAAFVLHEAEDPEQLLAEMGRVVKPNGRVVVVDWSPEASEPQNLPRRQRYAPATVQYYMRRAGLSPKPPVALNCANWMLEASVSLRATG